MKRARLFILIVILAKLWGPLLNEGRVDLVLSGHYHKSYKYEPTVGKNTFPVLGGPNDGVIKARVTPGAIDLQIVDLKGNIIDYMSVKAKKEILRQP